MVSATTRDWIEAVLKQQFGATYAGAQIDSRSGPDGEPAIYIHARFHPSEAIPSNAKIIDAAVALRDALLAADDERFPYLRPIYPEEPVADEAA